MPNKDATIEDIVEILHTMQDHTDEQFKELKNEMEDGFASVRSEIKNLWKELEEIKKRLEKLGKRTLEDDNAFGQEIFDLRQKVDGMEKALKLHGITV